MPIDHPDPADDPGEPDHPRPPDSPRPPDASPTPPPAHSSARPTRPRRGPPRLPRRGRPRLCRLPGKPRRAHARQGRRRRPQLLARGTPVTTGRLGRTPKALSRTGAAYSPDAHRRLLVVRRHPQTRPRPERRSHQGLRGHPGRGQTRHPPDDASDRGRGPSPTEQANAAEAVETLTTAAEIIEAAAKLLPNLGFF